MSYFERLNIRFGRRTPLVLQTEAAECGLASLAMVAAHHGQHQTLSSLRAQFGSSLKGVTLKDVVSVADRMGFSSRPLRLELNELKELRVPCILHWDLSHFVVLTEVRKDQVVILDPAIGKRELRLKEVSKHFTGVALELTPTNAFITAAKPPSIKISQLFGQFIGIKQAFIYLIGLALLVEIFSLISPLFMSLVIDEAIISANYELLNVLALGFALILLLNSFVSWLRHWALMGITATVDAQASENIMSHLISLPTSFFEARHLGDVLARLGSQDTILNALTEDFIEALLDGFMVIITLTVMLFISPSLTAVAIISAIVYALIRWFSYAPIRQAQMEGIIWSARSETHLLETLRGIRSVKLHNAQSVRRIQWMNLHVESINRGLTESKIGLIVGTSNTIVSGLIGILLVWLGARTILSGEMTVGLLLAFLAYANLFIGRVSNLIDAGVQLKMLSLHAERLADIALSPAEPKDVSIDGRVNATSAPLSIELRNVSYKYSMNDPYILKNLNLVIEAGDWVAITGPSGSGKSTMMKILSGLVTPTEGEVIVNGEPLKHFGLGNYRSKTGVVLQDDQLFSGSIQDNISFFADNIDVKKVEICAKLASIYDDVMEFPMRFATHVGDMGTVLSGGQKQRVLMARALYKQPGLLLFDEATSHLDVDNEREINFSLDRMAITRIVIAHRPETIRAANRIVELNDGIIESTNDPINGTITSRQFSRLE
jgi:ATP-binding cassette subfamily B protein RaxB